MYAPYDRDTASNTDRVAWALCQIIDADAPMRWTRYRSVAACLVGDPTWPDLLALAIEKQPATLPTEQGAAQEYRLLTRADVIEMTDEFLSEDTKRWVPCDSKLFCGMEYMPAVFLPARRAIAAAPRQAADAKGEANG